MPDPARWAYQLVEMQLTQVQLVFPVSIGNGNGSDGISIITVQIAREHDASCLGHNVEYAPCRNKTPFASAEVDCTGNTGESVCGPEAGDFVDVGRITR